MILKSDHLIQNILLSIIYTELKNIINTMVFFWWVDCIWQCTRLFAIFFFDKFLQLANIWYVSVEATVGNTAMNIRYAYKSLSKSDFLLLYILRNEIIDLYAGLVHYFAVIKYSDQKIFREKKDLFSFKSQSIIEGSQGRKFTRKIKAETTTRCCLLDYPLRNFSVDQDHLLSRMELLIVGWTLLQQLKFEMIIHRHIHRLIYKQFLIWNFSLRWP